ncbi:MAG: cupin domain-containing protein [Alphaproteobacteria bacterium]
MSDKRKPALATETLPARRGSPYPKPHDEVCIEREKRALGDYFELKDFGVNLLTLPPGAWSSQRHWHSHEDEFVYVLSGEPTLVTDEGETQLRPGMCAGFPANKPNGHALVNKTASPVTVLEVGSRKPEDNGYYSDIDMQILGRGKGGRFTRKNGKPYPA